MIYHGIDIHGDKGPIDWNAVRESGVRFAFPKVSEGYTFDDARYQANLSQARSYGVLTGGYHYARPDLHPGTEGARAEADHFCRQILACGWKKATDGKPVLDLEEGSGDLSGWSLAFCRRVEQNLGVKPIVYSYTSFIRSYIAGRPSAAVLAAEYPVLWIANYGSNGGVTPHTIGVGESPWKAWTIHQWTSNGSTPGVSGRCDRNITRDLNILRAVPLVATTPSKDDVWTFIAWFEAIREFKGGKPHDPATRPAVLRKKIPARWWARLLLFRAARRKDV